MPSLCNNYNVLTRIQFLNQTNEQYYVFVYVQGNNWRLGIAKNFQKQPQYCLKCSIIAKKINNCRSELNAKDLVGDAY